MFKKLLEKLLRPKGIVPLYLRCGAVKKAPLGHQREHFSHLEFPMDNKIDGVK